MDSSGLIDSQEDQFDVWVMEVVTSVNMVM
jgi:hypothetical protein